MRQAGIDIKLYLNIMCGEPGREAHRLIAEEVQASNTQMGWRKTV